MECSLAIHTIKCISNIHQECSFTTAITKHAPRGMYCSLRTGSLSCTGLKLTSIQCNNITNSIRVALATQFYVVHHLRIPIECTPGLLSNSIKLQVVNFTLRHQMIKTRTDKRLISRWTTLSKNILYTLAFTEQIVK